MNKKISENGHENQSTTTLRSAGHLFGNVVVFQKQALKKYT